MLCPLLSIHLQVWKGQGSRKWKHGQSDGFFFQFESPLLQKIWFIPCSSEKGQTLCRSLSTTPYPYMHPESQSSAHKYRNANTPKVHKT